ncbi:type VII secretion protein EccB [Streptomyces sp. WMMB303]|uniref:type VII secretion protein EccB n=1 Tax=Streptomyces sp. WMMB303 TaxID=3034154 RepID=UPI0023EB1C60|nr:type VII secretion protein EccB [Streptomyces sp. WMMB303]MDF4252605.1 type VII secretion protein EccB [Streptomyces sp. WMMB303]
MATTRELAEAHAYGNRRQQTGLLRGTDEALRDPRRRLNRSLGGGVALGVLVMAGFGIAGWLGGGKGPDLPGDGAVVVSGSGDRYVMSDGVLHPALNLSSALLVGGGKRTEVRADALKGVRRGPPVGIPAAPDALPGKSALSTEEWTVCTVPGEESGQQTRTHLYVAVPDTVSGNAEATVIAKSPGGDLWLLTQGRRFSLSEPVRDALGLQRGEQIPLADEVLATVPEGPAMRTPQSVQGEGDEPNARLPVRATIGDLAGSDLGGVNPQYYQVRDDGLVAVSEFVYTLLRTTGVDELELTPAQAAAAPRSEAAAPGDPAWPERLPEAASRDRGRPLCVSTAPGSTPGDAPWQATVTLPERMPRPDGLAPVSAAGGRPLGRVDELYVPPGGGAVVRATASAGSGGTYTLVTDTGTAYPFASADAVTRLGYVAKQAPSLPKGFVELLPRGPVLDPRSAAEEQQGGRTEPPERTDGKAKDRSKGDKSGEGERE